MLRMKKLLLIGIIIGVSGFAFFSKDSFLEIFMMSGKVSNSNLLIESGQSNEKVGFKNIDSDFSNEDIESRFPDFSDWQRPNGPPRVGLQVGHWKTQELPDELQRIRERGGGTNGGGKTEWEVNLVIVEKVASLLRSQGITVDIIPATVPKNYWADAFIAIHADGNTDPRVSGFKVASAYTSFPMFHSGEWRQQEGQESFFRQWTSRLHGSYSQGDEANKLAELLEKEYQQSTDLDIDRNVSHNMRGYYAFNWRRYKHAVHPMTAAVILEAGFLTSPNDRDILINNPDKAATGIANAVRQFLKEKNLL